jgi:hypothetical protein
MSSPYDLEAMARLGRKCLSCAELETECTRLRTLLTHQEQALQEIARLRLATDEGSLRVRADRMWEIALAALQQAPR